jgi:hypothetical protein
LAFVFVGTLQDFSYDPASGDITKKSIEKRLLAVWRTICLTGSLLTTHKVFRSTRNYGEHMQHIAFFVTPTKEQEDGEQKTAVGVWSQNQATRWRCE